MAMGALGAAYLGRTDNQAANIILKAVDQDLEQQKLSREDKFRAMDRQLQGIKLKISEKSQRIQEDRKSTRLNSSHRCISYAVFCLKKKNKPKLHFITQTNTYTTE